MNHIVSSIPPVEDFDYDAVLNTHARGAKRSWMSRLRLCACMCYFSVVFSILAAALSTQFVSFA
uniref:Uncharacterized protein n=1 Tax=Physcomitrium patens TaxID=3218 RepID=A0A2K1IJJ0_PHYPA|nr:hypothetical protein PHYPA_028137 [Physcomitrium patens]